jgi:hypothetical protein
MHPNTLSINVVTDTTAAYPFDFCVTELRFGTDADPLTPIAPDSTSTDNTNDGPQPMLCGDTWVDVSTDNDNCGSCGEYCPCTCERGSCGCGGYDAPNH